MTQKPIYWCRAPVGSANWGDDVAPHIFEFLSGFKATFSNVGKRILTVGSILHHAHNGDEIWGTGVMHEKFLVSCKDLLFHSVRGPLTRDLVSQAGHECPEIYGDPAILAPFIFKVNSETVPGRIGFVSHYADEFSLDVIKQLDYPGVVFPSIQASTHGFVYEISKCESVLSSSLHGIILAEALGKKACYVRVGDFVCGGDFKFQDYYASTGRELLKADWREPLSRKSLNRGHFSEALKLAQLSKPPVFEYERFLSSCPFNYKKITREDLI